MSKHDANEMKKFEKIFVDSEFDEVVVDNSGDRNQGDYDLTLQVGYGDYEAEIISRTQAAGTNNAFRITGSITLEQHVGHLLAGDAVSLAFRDPRVEHGLHRLTPPCELRVVELDRGRSHSSILSRRRTAHVANTAPSVAKAV